MLRHRVIPLVLVDGYSVVKTIGFNQERRNLGNPIAVARIYDARKVDELILLDIDASKEGRCIDLATIEDIASECFMPLTVGGGLKTLEDIREVLSRGADKIALNTAAIVTPSLISEAANVFGSQCIIVSIDAKKTMAGDYIVYSHAGAVTDRNVFEWIKEVQEYGAGEILLNAVDRDGKMIGYDLDLIEMISKIATVPLIVAGGAAVAEDGLNAINAGADAVAIASIFHFTSITPFEVKQRIAAGGLPVRLG